MEVDVEEHFMHVASMEDDVVACGLAGCMVGCFEVKLSDGAKGCECAVQW